jgi:hypothetical protein
MSDKIGVSVEIVAVIIRGGPGHFSWRTHDPFDSVALGLCDLGRVKLKGVLGQKHISMAYGRIMIRELKKLGLELAGGDRFKKPHKGGKQKPRSK